MTGLLAVEVAASSAEYAWKREAQSADSTPHPTLSPSEAERMSGARGRGPEARSQKSEVGGEEAKQETENRSEFQFSDFKTVTLLERGTSRGVSNRELAMRLNQVLDGFRPQAVFIPGWSSRAAFIAMSWCMRNGVPVVAMSESTEWDEARSAWREAVKRRIVGLFSAALVGGRPQKDYMVKLGMPAERVFLGYDAVDNDYFSAKAEESRKKKAENRKQYALPENYFLASARFVEKKNLPRVLEAYGLYREKAEKLKSENLKAGDGNRKSEMWDLILLGDGELRPALTALRSALGLAACVHLPGFKQYPNLPAYYAHAGAFIHASTTEQWGLVVNEAMASGLPVLVSNRCGCATDLVQEGVNGFTFDPCDVEQLAKLMLRISDFRFPISDFGAASARIIANWGPERFAQGLKAATECALKSGAKRASLLARVLLTAIMTR